MSVSAINDLHMFENCTKIAQAIRQVKFRPIFKHHELIAQVTHMITSLSFDYKNNCLLGLKIQTYWFILSACARCHCRQLVFGQSHG